MDKVELIEKIDSSLDVATVVKFSTTENQKELIRSALLGYIKQKRYDSRANKLTEALYDWATNKDKNSRSLASIYLGEPEFQSALRGAYKTSFNKLMEEYGRYSDKFDKYRTPESMINAWVEAGCPHLADEVLNVGITKNFIKKYSK